MNKLVRDIDEIADVGREVVGVVDGLVDNENEVADDVYKALRFWCGIVGGVAGGAVVKWQGARR